MNKKTIIVKTLITEDEKNSNPIFKAIYKKIRNLTKKISSIEALQKENRDNLKPEQLLKIQKREQIGQQIVKCEEFAIFYKQLLQDKETANNIITDELIKIATALAVCQAVQQEGGCKDKTLQEVMTRFVQPITAQHSPTIPVGDRIVETVGLLTEYLQNDKYYTSCRNYISDIGRSSAIQSSKQSEKASSYRNKNKQKKQFQEVEQDKIQQKSHAKQQIEQNCNKQVHASQQKEKKDKSLEAKKSHSQQKQHKISENQLPPKAQIKSEGKENQKESNIQANKEQPKQNQTVDEQENNSKKVYHERKNQNRNYRQNRDYNNQYKNNNRNQQYQGKPRTWNRDKQYQERPRNYKPRQTVREGSDTSLEPTPQKIKKPKYVEKV